MTILIKDIKLNGKETTIQIDNNIISKINPKNPDKSDRILNGKGKAVIPSLLNNHTHAAMSLLRGYADDFPLQKWLSEYIWPMEKKLKAKDVYWGARLACLEMVKTGTTCFNDMYFFPQETARAAIDAGIRAVVSEVFFDPLETGEKLSNSLKKSIKELKKMDELITPAIGPHAIYTLSNESLAWLAEFSKKEGLLMHFHLSETKKEVDECIEKSGKRPVELLDELGFFSKHSINAHCVWLDEKEIKILAKRKSRAVYCPTSNQKLSVGKAMPFKKLSHAGVIVSLGTDGNASNNSLDLFEEMKSAVLLQKFSSNNPMEMTAIDAFKLCTLNAAESIGLNAGLIEEGKLADLCIVDLKNVKIVPGHDLVSDLVYSADGSCIETVICNGKIVMLNRKVEGEEEIIEKARKQAFDLVQR